MKSDCEHRSDLLSLFSELAQAFPDMRFGQLIVNLSYLAREPSLEATWDVEDAELLAAARQLIAERRQMEGTKLSV